MSRYVCPMCGSSLDASEHCSCGARDKPVVSNRTDAIKAADGYKPHTVIFDEETTANLFRLPSSVLDKRKKEHEEQYQMFRKEIYNNICSRINQ